MDDIDISELDFLEHFGVKGMKWGVRRKRDVIVIGVDDQDPYADAKRMAKVVATSLLVTVGAATAGHYIGKGLTTIATQRRAGKLKLSSKTARNSQQATVGVKEAQNILSNLMGKSSVSKTEQNFINKNTYSSLFDMGQKLAARPMPPGPRTFAMPKVGG